LKEFYRFEFPKFITLWASLSATPNKSGFSISPHLLRQMPHRIVDYSGTTSSLAERDFAKLNLLICGKLENRSTWVLT
jgi:hypothetical protein